MLAGCGLQVPDRARDGLDVRWGGAAASADDGRAAGGEPAGRLGEVLGVARVGEARAKPAGDPGVGLDADRKRAAGGEPGDDVLQGGRPDGAVRADRADPQRRQRGGSLSRVLAPQGAAVVAEGQLGDHRQVTFGEGNGCGLGQRVDVAEGLQDDQVDPAGQRADLLAQDRLAVARRGAWCDGAHHGPDAARHQRGRAGAADSFPGQARAGDVDLRDPVLEA